MSDDLEQRIADMVKDMRFTRRKPASRQHKEICAHLAAGVDAAVRELRRLQLTLWHAVHYRKYHAFHPDEAQQALRDMARRLDALADDMDDAGGVSSPKNESSLEAP